MKKYAMHRGMRGRRGSLFIDLASVDVEHTNPNYHYPDQSSYSDLPWPAVVHLGIEVLVRLVVGMPVIVVVSHVLGRVVVQPEEIVSTWKCHVNMLFCVFRFKQTVLVKICDSFWDSVIDIKPELPFLNSHTAFTNERISVYLDKQQHVFGHKNYFVEQISNLSKGVVVVASALCPLLVLCLLKWFTAVSVERQAS